MEPLFARSHALIGVEGIEILKNAKVLVFGVGGVGSYTVEALTRAGVGHLTLIDKDVVDRTNLNRQLIATEQTVGMDKVEVAARRIYEINPAAFVIAGKKEVTPHNIEIFMLGDYHYVVDAVDNVAAKLAIIEACYRKGVPCISAMGTGNKLDPAAFEVTDIYKTAYCPLAKVIRQALKKKGIPSQKVVYSAEQPKLRCTPPASVPFVPPVAGMILAGEVIKDLIGL